MLDSLYVVPLSRFWASMKQKTVKELIAEMGERTVSMEEIEAARAYERSLIPEGTVIPKSGDIYRSKRNVAVTTMITFAAPFTGGHECKLPPGIEVKIGEIYEDLPVAINCIPIKSEELESTLVPENDINSDKYTGYYLTIKTHEFKDGFEKIED